MHRIVTLTRMALKELVYEKAFYIVVFCIVTLFALSFLFGTLSFDEEQKIFADFGYLAIQLSTVGMGLFFGAYSLAKEIEKQTCLIVLIRPISRLAFVLGKFLSISILNLILSTVLSVFMLFYLNLSQDQYFNHFKIVSSLYFQSNIVIAIAMFFAILVRPMFALLMTSSVYLIGFWIEDIRYFGEKAKEPLFQFLAEFFNWITPQMYRMNWKSYYFISAGIDFKNYVWMFFHTLSWSVLIMFLVSLIFRRKDLV